MNTYRLTISSLTTLLLAFCLNQTTDIRTLSHSLFVGAYGHTPLQERVPSYLGLRSYKYDCANLLWFDLGSLLSRFSVNQL